MDMESLYRAVINARQDEERQKSALSEATRVTENAEQALMDAMTEQNLTSLRIAGLGMAVLEKPKAYPRIKEGMTEQVMEWLRASGHGDAIKPTVHHKTLTSIYRDMTEGGRQAPDLFEVFYKPTLSIRK